MTFLEFIFCVFFLIKLVRQLMKITYLFRLIIRLRGFFNQENGINPFTTELRL